MDTAYKAADTALTNRINAIDNSSTGTVHGLDTRLSNIEAEIGNLNSSRIDTLETDVNNAHTATYTTLASRFAAVEATANAAAVKTTVDGAIEGLDARLDKIDGGSTLSGDTTLASRVSTVESDLNTETTGIKARLTAVETTAGTAL